MSNTPKRPDLEAIKARANALQGLPRADPKLDLTSDWLLFHNIPALIAWIEALEAVEKEAREVYRTRVRPGYSYTDQVQPMSDLGLRLADLDGDGDG